MPERDSHEYIALSAAAAQALARLVPERVAEDSRSVESRKLIAVAISALIPVYRRASPSGAHKCVTEAELSAGQFRDGAMSFVSGSGGEIELLVRQSEMETAIGKLVDEYVGVDHSRAA